MGQFKRVAFALFVLMAALTGISVVSPLLADDRNDASLAMQKAQLHIQRGDYRAARIELLNAIKADPEWVDARISQAKIYLKLSDPVGAEAELRRAIDLGADADSLRHLMADTLFQMGENSRAKRWLMDGNIPLENMGYAMRILAQIETADGNMDAARNAFDRALGYTPDDSTLWTAIAQFRLVNGDQGGAVAAVEYAVGQNPGDVRALQFRGELMRSQYGLASALPWFERALQIDPTDVPVLEAYGVTLGDMGRMRDMLDVARRIIALHPRNADAFFMQAVLAARAEQFPLAQSLLQKSEGALGRVPSFMQVEGIVEFQLGNYHKASERFDRLLAMQPHSLRTQHLLARALYAKGEHEQLLERFVPIAERNGSTIYLKTLVARSLEAIGEPEAALVFLQRATERDRAMLTMLDENEDASLLTLAAERDPLNARAVIPFVRKLINQGNYDRALAEAQRLASANAGAPDAHMLVGDVQLLRNVPQLALESYERAAQIRYSEPVLQRMVMALKAVGRGDDAERVLLRFAGFNPANVGASRMLADVYIDYRNWEAAQAMLQELHARTGSINPSMMSDLALAQLRNGSIEDAQLSSRLGYEAQTANALSTHIYGLTLSQSEAHIDIAVEFLEKAQALNPANPWLDFHLARAYVDSGARGKAISALRGALAKGDFPEQDAARRLLLQLTAKS
jgi:tetratricopeptide (TPR) repeat protein